QQNATPAASTPRATASLPGQECAKCHADVVHSFPNTLHGKSAQFLSGGQSAKCEACHGDGAKHNESGRPSDIGSPNKMPAAEASAMCLTCHARDASHAGWTGSPHDRRNMTCVSCHNEHRPKSAQYQLSARNDLELCVTCHKEKRKATLQRSTHLFTT